MKIKTFSAYAKKDLLKIIQKIRYHCHFTGKYRRAAIRSAI